MNPFSNGGLDGFCAHQPGSETKIADFGDCSELSVPPLAPVMLESMRSLGYSFESALADVIDNSISATARNISVRFSPYGTPYIAVIDDGWGMTDAHLVEAMRHGSRDPLAPRNSSDLGRFGLGLKTASLSQCRSLTVVSYKGSQLTAKKWDLDFIAQRRDWILLSLNPKALSEIPHVDQLIKAGHGTIVVWQKFDRHAASAKSMEEALSEDMDRARSHLALVFHRYLDSSGGIDPVSISINANLLEPVDPFLTWHPATQHLPHERLRIEGAEIQVAPYILPHASKLGTADIRRAGGEENIRRAQGFYVYRNRRLITWGTWFRLAKHHELSRLARIRVDIPNSLDHLWTLDVRKSSAFPPQAVREALRVVVGRIAESSKRVYSFRGKRSLKDGVRHAWERLVVRQGIEYRLNREHDVILAIKRMLPQDGVALLEDLLHTIETNIPFDAIYEDLASERAFAPVDRGEENHLEELANRMLNALGSDIDAANRLVASLSKIEPFSNYPETTENIVRRILNVS